MNISFRTVWNNSLGAWVAVSEVGHHCGKQNKNKSLVSLPLIGFLSYLISTSVVAACNPTFASNGDVCQVIDDNFVSSSVQIGAESGGKLEFTKDNVNISINSPVRHALISSGSGSTVSANNLSISVQGGGTERALNIDDGGEVIVNGNLSIIRNNSSREATAVRIYNNGASLYVAGDLKIEDYANHHGDGLFLRGTSQTLRVDGSFDIKVGQAGGVESGSSNHIPSINNGGQLGLRTDSNSNIDVGSLRVEMQQHLAVNWDHNAAGGSALQHIKGETSFISYGGLAALYISQSSSILNEQSRMVLGSGYKPDIKDGTFQLIIGDKTTFDMRYDGPAIEWVSTTDSTSNADIKIEKDVDFNLTTGVGVVLSHNGLGYLSFENLSNITASNSAATLSVSGPGKTSFINHGSLNSLSTAGAFVFSAKPAPNNGQRSIEISNTGTIAGEVSAIHASEGDAETTINLRNTGKIATTNSGSKAVIDFSSTLGSNNFFMQDGLVSAVAINDLAYRGGDGIDNVSQTGGVIQGIIQTMKGDDSFIGTSGQLVGGLEMGEGNDSATFGTSYDLSKTLHLDGGSGLNSLTLQGQSLSLYSALTDMASKGVNLQNWQSVNLEKATRAVLTGDLQLGGSSGVLSIDDSSILVFQPFSGAANTIEGSVSNAGTIDIRNPASNNFDSLTIQGDYSGNNGNLLVDTVLGNSQSPSDQLIVDNGSITGSTKISVGNRSGLGAQTTGNGILVVSAINGSTSTKDAFSLLGEVVSAGAYTYRLERNNNESWYLTSAATPVPESPPEYSTQTSVVAAVPSLALLHSASTLDGWQERMGARVYGYGLNGEKKPKNQPGWTRLIGKSGSRGNGKEYYNVDTNGGLSRSSGFNYDTYIVQMGMDFHRKHTGDSSHAVGAYIALGQTTGDANHWSFSNQRWAGAGDGRIDGTTLGLYWSRIAEHGQYLDTVLQYTDYRVKTNAKGVSSTKSNGRGFAASFEVGAPYILNAKWNLTPQMQVRWQHVSLEDIKAVESGTQIGSYRMGSAKSFWGRLSIQGTYQTRPSSKAWVRADLMREFKGDTTTQYTATQGGVSPSFKNSIKGTEVGLTAGLDHQVSKALALYASTSYTKAIDHNKSDAWSIKAGFRWDW